MLVAGRSVNYVVERRVVERGDQLAQCAVHNAGERFNFVALDIAKRITMLLGRDPGFEGEPGSEWGERDKLFVFMDNALTTAEFLTDDVGRKRNVLCSNSSALLPRPLPLPSLWNDRGGDQLRVRVVETGSAADPCF